MKKIINLLAVLLISAAASFAQTTAPANQHLKKDGTPDKRYKAGKAPAATPSPAATGSSPTSNDMQMNTPNTGARLKKDGTPDKRFSNKTPASRPAAAPAQPSATNPPAQEPMDPSVRTSQTTPAKKAATSANGRHLKADGTPDMRYKENRTPGTDKNGSQDKRYKKPQTIN